MEEFKRIFSVKMWLVLAAVFILNLILFLYGNMSGEKFGEISFSNSQYNMLIDKYKDISLEEAKKSVTSEYGILRKYVKGNEQTSDSELLSYYQTLSDSEKVSFEKQLVQIKSKLTYLSGYKDIQKNVFTNAENMKRFSIFSNQKTFSYNNILRTAQDFERVRAVEVQLDNDRGVDKFVHYKLLYYIAAALMVVIIYSFFDERENRMWQIVHNTPKGRIELAVKRIFVICGGSFLILGLLYFSTFLVSMCLYGGFEALGNPIQTLEDYGKFTYAMSKGYYVAALFFMSWFVLCALSIILWSLFAVFRNRNHTLVCMAVFTGLELLIYQKIEIQSVYSALHYVNIVSILNIQELYSTYNNWGVGVYVFSVLSVILFALFVITVIAAIIAVERHENMRPNTKTSRVERIFAKLHEQYQKVFSRYPFVLKEVHKLVISGKGVWVVICVLAVTAYFSTQGQMNFTDRQKEWDEMYLLHGGKDYTYVTNYVAEAQQNFTEAKQVLENAAEKYEQGEITVEEYSKAQQTFSFQQSTMQFNKEYMEKLEYSKQIKADYNIDTWLVSDRGYEEIFGEHAGQREFIILIALITAVMFVVSECFSMEHRTGMKNITHSALNGHGWFWANKITACIIFTSILTALVYGMDFFNLYKMYGMPYLDAPAISLTFLSENPTPIMLKNSIGGLMCVFTLLKYAAALFTMALAIIISKVIGKKGSRSVIPIVLIFVIAFIYFIRSSLGIF